MKSKSKGKPDTHSIKVYIQYDYMTSSDLRWLLRDIEHVYNHALSRHLKLGGPQSITRQDRLRIGRIETGRSITITLAGVVAAVAAVAGAVAAASRAIQAKHEATKAAYESKKAEVEYHKMLLENGVEASKAEAARWKELIEGRFVTLDRAKNLHSARVSSRGLVNARF